VNWATFDMADRCFRVCPKAAKALAASCEVAMLNIKRRWAKRSTSDDGSTPKDGSTPDDSKARDADRGRSSSA